MKDKNQIRQLKKFVREKPSMTKTQLEEFAKNMGLDQKVVRRWMIDQRKKNKGGLKTYVQRDVDAFVEELAAELGFNVEEPAMGIIELDE